MSQHGKIQREILPIPDRPHAGLITYDAKDPDTSFPPIEPRRPPRGAPNVLIILLDDVGFEFSGEVNWVEIDLGEDAEDADHYIDPEERLRVYMGIQ